MRALTRRRNSARQLINNFPPCTYVLIAQHDRPIDLQNLGDYLAGIYNDLFPSRSIKREGKTLRH